jgi:HlyD family secretion protein
VSGAPGGYNHHHSANTKSTSSHLGSKETVVLHRYTPWLLLVGAVGAFTAAHASKADDPPGRGKDAKAPTPLTMIKVEKGPLTAVVTLKGVVQGEKVTEVAVRLKAWAGPLMVKEAVEHGKSVKAGEVLLRFDTEKIDLALRDAKQERELAELAIRQAELELPILERQFPLDLAVAEREAKQTKDDLRKFLEIDRPLGAQAAEFGLKSATFSLEFATDELKQLRKMYRDKDLTEETEELILKRYKFGVESAEFRLRQVKAQTDQTLKNDLPRREQNAKDAVEKAELTLAKARDVQPLVLRQKKLALAKMKYEDAKAKDRLADLEQDRAALVVKAPADGLVYHGRYVRGQWTTPPGPALLPGGTVPSGDVIFSVVGVGKRTVRAEAEEKELPGLKADLAGRVTPTAFPDQRVSAKLARIGAVPQGGKFELLTELTGDIPDGLVPGMTCTVRFVTVRKESALTVPAAAVGEDDADGSRFVYKPGRGKPERKAVKVGVTVGDRIEILDGLSEGDDILAAKP